MAKYFLIMSLVLGLASLPCGAAELSVTPDTAQGMELTQGKYQEQYIPIALDARKAWPLRGSQAMEKRLYFTVTDENAKDGARPSVVFKVDYYDQGTGVVGLEYDSLEERPIPGAFKRAGSIILSNTKTWKSVTFAVTDARFDNRCDAADFRLALETAPEFFLGAIRLEPSTTTSGIKWSPTPRGKIIEGIFDKSAIFPGTTRKYWVYIPPQYDPTKPACVYVGQDGLDRRFTSALNRLIFNHQIPAMVGIFIQPGQLSAASSHEKAGRANRCFEYDSMGDRYARFLLEEMLPYVAQTHQLNLSSDGNDRCIGGCSSGGICAFNAAWERPDAFRRVYSISGSFVSFRGGSALPILIRKCEPKPLRVFLHVASNDMENTGGNWYLANQEMEQALKFSGYDYQFRSSNGTHGDRYTDIFPEAMAWLWRGWPAPVISGSGSPRIQDILLRDEAWHLIGEGYHDVRGLAVTPNGEVFFCDAQANQIFKIGIDGKINLFLADARHSSGLATSAHGQLLAVSSTTGQLIAIAADQTIRVLARDTPGHALAATRSGGVYVTGQSPNSLSGSNVWYIAPTGEKSIVDTGIKEATGLAISPDEHFLYVADGGSHWVYSYQIEADGTLRHRQPFHWLHVPDSADDSGVEGLAIDRRGALYAATRMGIQTSDLTGHNQCLLPIPSGRVLNLAFGGADFDVLYAASSDKIFARKVKVKGIHPFQSPLTPTPWGL